MADISKKYVKLEQREHVLQKPGMYIGSVEADQYEIWLLNDEGDKMEKRFVYYIAGLFKIFDEIVANASDHYIRLKTLAASGQEVNPVKDIKVTIDKETGVISVYNSGDGIDIVVHQDHKVYIPELIFGNLLTSTNYSDDSKELIGTFGIGGKASNIFSEWFEIETVDANTKQIYKQRFEQNMSIVKTPEIKKCAKKPYTLITFKPDYTRFGNGMKGLSNDMYEVMRKRVYDLCAVTDKDINVFFNDQKLEFKTFENYVNLYIGSKSEHTRVYEKLDDKWEVIASYNAFNGFEQISFVNGLLTIRGGKHVDYIVNQIVKKTTELIGKKSKNTTVKPQAIKDNLIVFIKCSIVNPTFDSQSKETLTTPATKFGSKPDISDKFIDKLYKSGLADKVLEICAIHEEKALKKTDGKKRDIIRGLPKLEDANWAGTAKSKECLLLLTEGDSASSSVLAGLSVVGKDKYGVFPLKGKVMNVKDANSQKIADNDEIANIKKILGLETGKNYTKIDDLRYGGIMLVTDSDVDGSHIKGLIMNLFHSLWPSLVKDFKFIHCLQTPIVKARKRDEVISFYTLTDFENWRQENPSGWEIKYYKGLGTSTEDEAKDWFKNMKMVTYKFTEDSNENLDLAFNKKRADDRKSWLGDYNRQNILDCMSSEIPYEDFINKELIHFSNYDVERSIPSMVDGLKISQRKILFACFKRNLTDKEIRVAQLASYVSEHSAYHHGETSLQGAIISMAQDFVGSNNINLLKPNGQFGCLDPETDILLWDTSIKKAKDIVVGDKLIGDDGKIRNVLKVTNGIDDMYEIDMGKKGSYIVNSQHILTLKLKCNKVIYYANYDNSWKTTYFDTKINKVVTKMVSISNYNDDKVKAYNVIANFVQNLNTPDIVDIKLQDFINLPKYIQRLFYCIKNSKCIQWEKQDVPFDPYVFGLWLGDGMKRNDMNPWKELLRKCKLFNNKHVPKEFIMNDKETRLQVLAGIIDTDGTIKYCNDIPFIEISQSKRLHSNIITSIDYIAKSLGYITNISERQSSEVTKKGESKTMLSLIISGENLNEIPTRLPRKKIIYSKEKLKDYSKSTFKVKYLGKGEFCGWSVDGNERFLLGDFTITHNSRLHGGKDAAQPRYIYTLLTDIATCIYRKQDNCVLKYLEDDGLTVEPEHYIPIIPMILVNGALGIGTGFSTTIPSYNPMDIISLLKRMLKGELVCVDDDDLVPWIRGFKGEIRKINGKYTSIGKFAKVSATKIEVTELPVGYWTFDFKADLEKLLDKMPDFKKYENHSSGNVVNFTLHFANGAAIDKLLEVENNGFTKFENTFGLVSSKGLSTTNMYAFNSEGAIRKYDTVFDVINEFYDVRLDYYKNRKEYILNRLEYDAKLMANKIRFIKEVVNETLHIHKMKKAELDTYLQDNEYMKHEGGFEYITRIPVYNLTTDKVDDLERDMKKAYEEVENLKIKKEQDIWFEELTELETVYERFLECNPSAAKKSRAKKN